MKECLVAHDSYELILSYGELALLADLIEVLEVFEIFTVFVQGEYYPTLNSIALFYSEIVKK